MPTLGRLIGIIRFCLAVSLLLNRHTANATCHKCHCEPGSYVNRSLTCLNYCSCVNGDGCVYRCPATYDPNIEICVPIESVSLDRQGVCQIQNAYTCGRTYEIHKYKDGETWESISRQHGTTADCMIAVFKWTFIGFFPDMELITPDGWCYNATGVQGQPFRAIADRFGITLDTLITINHIIENPNGNCQENAILVVICPYFTYACQSGDSYASLAEIYGVDVNYLQSINNNVVLGVGVSIIIPYNYT